MGVQTAQRQGSLWPTLDARLLGSHRELSPHITHIAEAAHTGAVPPLAQARPTLLANTQPGTAHRSLRPGLPSGVQRRPSACDGVTRAAPQSGADL